MADGKSARDHRLAEALRANLRRRKSQSRAREDLGDAGPLEPARSDSAPSHDDSPAHGPADAARAEQGPT